MIQFPDKKERELRKNSYIEQADNIMKEIDREALKRCVSRAYLGKLEGDNKLKVSVDKEHMEKAVKAMELLVKASKYNK